jgi:quercetin dioxygenase-like cupin family protein
MKKGNKTINARISAVIIGLLTLGSVSELVAAPNQVPSHGLIPAVSDHYKTKPSFYDFTQMPAEQIAPGVKRTFIMGTESSVVRWELKSGTHLPLHFHVNEQMTRVESGELQIYSQGDEYVVKPGQVMLFPPNVPHEFIALKDTVIIEHHTPARQDFINGDFNKK